MSVLNYKNKGEITMEDNIKKGITAIFEAITTENESEAMGFITESLLAMKESKYKLNDPENFDLFINNKVDNVIETLTEGLHDPTKCKDTYKPNFIYRQYGFLERNIEKLCEDREGFSCSADKSRHIMRLYLKYVLTGDVPEINPGKKDYWSPKFGDGQTWMDFCDGLYELYYGRTEKYLMSLNILLKAEIKRFERTLHLWYLEFNDGEIIQVGNTWDENLTCPMKLVDGKDFYIINKKKVANKDLDKYEVSDDSTLAFLYDNYVKIPNTEVRGFFKKSEIKRL